MALINNQLLSGGSPKTLLKGTAVKGGYSANETFTYTPTHDCTLILTVFNHTGNGNQPQLSSSHTGFQWNGDQYTYGGYTYSYCFGVIPNAKKGVKYSIAYKANMGSIAYMYKLGSWEEIY